MVYQAAIWQFNEKDLSGQRRVVRNKMKNESTLEDEKNADRKHLTKKFWAIEDG